MTKKELIASLDVWIEEQRLAQKADNTLTEYRQRVQKFIDWCPEDTQITKDLMLQYNSHLFTKTQKGNTMNAWIVALNKYMRWMGREDLVLNKIKIQIEQSNEEVLTVQEYKRMCRKAKELGMYQIVMIMETLAKTGIRVSELRFFKVETLNKYISLYNKGKMRNAFVPQDLLKHLRQYCKEHHIKKGYIFVSPQIPDKMVHPTTIWRHMQKVAGLLRINLNKVHAHTFRHLYAQQYMKTEGANLGELSDILGHSSIETTRGYAKTSDRQKLDRIETMNFNTDD